MDWLAENWILIAVLIGGYFAMSRMGMGCGMGHSRGHGHTPGTEKANGHPQDDTSTRYDPVSLKPLSAASGFASIHQGQVFEFEDRANRDAFEEEPEKYLSGLPASVGHTKAATHANHHAHKRHGCC